MDDLEQKKQEARDAGYSEEEINAYLNVKDTPVPQTPAPDRSEEYLGLGQGIVGKAIETGAELYAGKKLIVDPIRNAIRNRGAAAPSAPVAPSTLRPSPAPVATPSAPVNPYAGNPQAAEQALSKLTPAQLEAYYANGANPQALPENLRPGAPQPKIGGPAAAEGSNFIENITKKYLPAAGRAFGAAMDTPVGRAVGTGARILGSAPVMGAQLALTPSSTGPVVPSKGPLRGSEINPNTGRGWTQQELAAYESRY